MVWNNDECYVKFLQVSDFLKGLLGITKLDCDLSRPVLLPYQTQIIEYLNTRLIVLGTNDIKTLIQEILDIFGWGADLICTKSALELAREIGIGSEDEEYDQDRFVFSWADFMSTLRMRLLLQYGYLFESDDDGECENCCCGHSAGDTTEDYESWVSNVYPNDEVYDRTNYDRVNTTWKISKNRYCECYRHESQSSNDSSGD